jgi:hypothetical protein
MPDQNLIPKETANYLNDLIEAFGKKYSSPDYWDYVLNSLLQDRSLMLGNAKSQSGRVDRLYSEWQAQLPPLEIMAENAAANWEILTDEQKQYFTDYFNANPELAKEYGFKQTAEDGDTSGKYTLYTDEQITQMALDSGLTEEEVRRQLAFNTAGLKTTADSSISPDTQAQIDYAREQSDQDRRNQLLATQKAGAEQSSASTWQSINNAQQEWSQGTSASQKQRQQELNDAYEQARADMVASLNPTDWVQKHLISNKPNPYTLPETLNTVTSDEDKALNLKESISFYSSQVKALEEQINDVNNPLLQKDSQQMMDYLKGNLQNAKQQQADLQAGKVGSQAMKNLMESTGMSFNSALRTTLDYSTNPNDPKYQNLSMQEKQALSYAALDAGYAGYGSDSGGSVKKEPELDIPDWLRPSIGGGNVASVKGTDVTKWAQPVTPSGQLWNQWNPTQKEMYSSYAKGQGSQRPDDLVSQMQMQTPRNINFGNYWKSARGNR